MPRKLERKLRRTARRKYPHEPRKQSGYVYGALRRMGWKPRRER